MPKLASTLAELVAPLPQERFLSLLRERKLTFLRGTDPDRYKPFLDWAELLKLIERGEHPRGLTDFRIAKESITVPWDRWLTRDQSDNTIKVDVEKLNAFLAAGYSLIVTPINPYVPSLAALCDNISAELSEFIKVGVIVTGGAGGAFKLHYDPEDLIILQVEGTKRWQIYGPAVSNPGVGLPKPSPPPETSPIFDEVLQPGDFLFLPAGSWHHCENGPDRSLHLGIFFMPPTCWDALKTIILQLLSEERFRTPLTRLGRGAELASLEADIKYRLIERISQLKLADFSGGLDKKQSFKADNQ
ncbi:MAG TPA: cupin domain-containing protein [Rhizomicrobium sp.]|nr:cupin domain-containing protein [Rhizomicrobium sp.]